jgi:hypothetical protein
MGWDDPSITTALKAAADDKHRVQTAPHQLSANIHGNSSSNMELDYGVDIVQQQQGQSSNAVLPAPALIDIQGRLTWLDRNGLHVSLYKYFWAV